MRVKGDPNCTSCKLHKQAEEVCIMGAGPKKAQIMVIGRMPNSDSYQATLEAQLEEVGLDPTDVYYTSAIKCRNFEQNTSNLDIKTCRQWLDKEIEEVKPTHIVTMGNEALLSATGHSGIMKYRGRPITRSSATIIPTISPSAVNRNPGQRPGYIADLRQFANRVLDREVDVVAPTPRIINTMDDLEWLNKILSKSALISYDVETHSEEWRSDGRIVSVSGTCVIASKSKSIVVGFALPLYHPESPWKRKWRAVLAFLAKAWQSIPKIIAHNGKYDDKWMQTFNCPIITTFDTMLAVHILNENVAKGLKPQAQSRLGVAPWGVDTKQLLNMPIQEVLEYNFLDTYYTYLLYLQLREELKSQPRLLRLFVKLMMPAHKDLVFSELRGIWYDIERHKERKPVAQAKLKEIEDNLKKFLPKRGENDPRWPTDARGRPSAINFNASNFARWFLFDWLELPVIMRGKEKNDGSPGDPSMAEGILQELEYKSPAVKLMLARIEWQKMLSSFFNAYEEIYDDDHRIHTNFKLAGTVTGRLSSGKADADKISGTRGKVRGVNLQQVPRDSFVRGLFGAPPGWSFVEADYSQIELRVAAFLAHERHMLQLYAQGADIHLTTAARVSGLPESQVSKKIRKELGKPVNFGFLYGMGWRKFIQTAFQQYGAVFDEEGARAARQTYFDLYPGLISWHARQRRLVEAYGRVQSPLGRVRHLPDIYSPDQGVRAEAERQAINSPVQGFASDLAVLSMTVINQRLKEKGYAANCLGLVHDAINFEVRNDHVGFVLPIIKDTMEDMSIVRKKFGVNLTIPIISDLKVGQHWGDAVELEADQVYSWSSHSTQG